jgi:2-polyprenyl-3-methyl-5-hydroxy-6-metoxy-1,4-benzoquinol methylase
MKSPNHLTEVKCNICGSNDAGIIFPAGIGNIVRCNKCGLFYRTPRLSDAAEADKYRHQIYDESYSGAISKAKKDVYISTLKKLGSLRGKILDVGCSEGYFLTLAREQGWNPYGIEISELLLRRARENLGEKQIFGEPLKNARFPSDFFDVITLWDVLDHLMDPLAELTEIRRILKKDGLLVIRVRNVSFHTFMNKLSQKKRFRTFKSLTVFHLYGFNNKNIKNLLEKANFSKIKIKNSKLTTGDPYSQMGFFGNKSIRLIKTIYSAFSKLMSLISLGRILISPSIIVYAEKT